MWVSKCCANDIHINSKSTLNSQKHLEKEDLFDCGMVEWPCVVSKIIWRKIGATLPSSKEIGYLPLWFELMLFFTKCSPTPTTIQCETWKVSKFSC